MRASAAGGRCGSKSTRARPSFSVAEKRRILERLTAAEGLEKYLHTRYVGQKRFSLEGGESLIVLLDELVRYGASKKVRSVVMGMAHRGRLNVLVNVVGKPLHALFDEFDGKDAENLPDGDVKYHKGFSSVIADERWPRRCRACIQSLASGNRESSRAGHGARQGGGYRRRETRVACCPSKFMATRRSPDKAS